MSSCLKDSWSLPCKGRLLFIKCFGYFLHEWPPSSDKHNNIMSILKRKILEVKEAVLSCLQVVNQWQSGSKYVLCLVNSIPIRLTSSFFEKRKAQHHCLVCCDLNSTSKSNLRGKEFISTYPCSSLWREIKAGTFRQELKQKSLKHDIDLFPRFMFSYPFYTYQNYLARSSTSNTQLDLSNQWINQECSPRLAQRPICWRRFLNWGFLDNSNCIKLIN